MNLLIDYAMSFVGTPYKWGGATPIGGIDCSGLVQCILSAAGIDPIGDQTAQALYNYFETNGSVNTYGAGALAFYGESVAKVTHVAFCVDQYRMIEAGGGGSKVNTLQDAIVHEAFVRVRLIKSRKDLVSVIKPRYVLIGYP